MPRVTVPHTFLKISNQFNIFTHYLIAPGQRYLGISDLLWLTKEQDMFLAEIYELHVPPRIRGCMFHQPKTFAGVLELHIHTDPWDPFLKSRAKRVPKRLNYFPKSTT